jgi:hypothetical protein
LTNFADSRAQVTCSSIGNPADAAMRRVFFSSDSVLGKSLVLCRRFARAQEGLLPVDAVVLAGALALSGATAAWLVTDNLHKSADKISVSISACQAYVIDRRGDIEDCR